MKKPIPLERMHKNSSGHYYFKYRCACGNEFIALKNKVSTGETSSCGCFRRKRMATMNLKHGNSTTENLQKWKVWNGMMDRCYNSKNKSYRSYGARGISVCADWHDTKAFFEWMKLSGYTSGLTLERIDVNGGYHPDNCKWIPRNNQSYNTTVALGVDSAMKIREMFSSGISIQEIATTYNVAKNTIYRIVKRKSYKWI